MGMEDRRGGSSPGVAKLCFARWPWCITSVLRGCGGVLAAACSRPRRAGVQKVAKAASIWTSIWARLGRGDALGFAWGGPVITAIRASLGPRRAGAPCGTTGARHGWHSWYPTSYAGPCRAGNGCRLDSPTDQGGPPRLSWRLDRFVSRCLRLLGQGPGKVGRGPVISRVPWLPRHHRRCLPSSSISPGSGRSGDVRDARPPRGVRRTCLGSAQGPHTDFADTLGCSGVSRQ
ncbi:hypothetical protein ATK36_0892 [Amycolatopsis sulphurea]|uniref:Uncharacterized protein n=1 Tax=Amycolatopsis sulphurea TaxID=76022 RepID=A0A2A9G0R4_9PSEU|nr:hypothetical protein ATK36_0892 [Amycolatopsis sulphurea]